MILMTNTNEVKAPTSFDRERGYGTYTPTAVGSIRDLARDMIARVNEAYGETFASNGAEFKRVRRALSMVANNLDENASTEDVYDLITTTGR